MARASKVNRGLAVLLVSLAALLAPRGVRADTLRLGPELGLGQALLEAEDGDTIEIPAGHWDGGVRIEHSVTLRGEPGAVVDGRGHGTVITVLAPNVVIEGLELRSSGVAMINRETNVDACLWAAPTAVGLSVRGNQVLACLFGIYIQQAHHAVIEDNVVRGRSDMREADRGNGIHVFDADFVTVRGNQITGGRDGLYIAASDDCLFERNVVADSRYAIHYMWSHRNVLRGNETVDSLVGFALMQSHDLQVRDNLISRNRRAGLLIRDGESSVYRGNTITENGSGVFIYNSVRERIEENLIAHNQVGLRIWGAMMVEDTFSNNSVIGNAQQIFYFSNRDLDWGVGSAGNYYSDYLGWDQDDDGVGDRPYRVDNLTASLLARYPASVLLLRSPALELLSHLEQRLPLFRVPTITDRAPLVTPAHHPAALVPSTERPSGASVGSK